MSLLPPITTLAEYRPLRHTRDPWLPAMREICARHGLPTDPLEPFPDGSYVVFAAGPEHVIKLFVPVFDDMPQELTIERVLLRHVHGRVGLETPQLVAEGEIEGWSYILMTRVQGQRLDTVWNDMEPTNRLRVARSLGEAIARFHTLPTEGLAPLALDWPTFVADQARTFAERQIAKGAPRPLAEACAAWIADMAADVASPGRTVVLHCDFTGEHPLVQRRRGEWTLTGLVDFADGMLGRPEYEFGSPSVYLTALRRAETREMLLGAGYPAVTLTRDLSRRLVAFTMLHRFFNLKWTLGSILAGAKIETPEDLREALFPV